jgi:hypothetical protein
MMKKSESAKIESVCTYCGVGCDIAAEVSNGHIERIFAEKDGVVSQGKLCIKGRYGFDFVESRERVREPRIRKKFIEKNRQLLGEELLDRLRDFDSEYYSCELDTALDIAALKLEECSEKFGEESFCAIGGARSRCEKGHAFQKFFPGNVKSPRPGRVDEAATAVGHGDEVVVGCGVGGEASATEDDVGPDRLRDTSLEFGAAGGGHRVGVGEAVGRARGVGGGARGVVGPPAGLEGDAVGVVEVDGPQDVVVDHGGDLTAEGHQSLLEGDQGRLVVEAERDVVELDGP